MGRFKPAYEGEMCSLGPAIIQWMFDYLNMPDAPAGVPYVPSVEQAEFIVRYYETDPACTRRVLRRGVYSRPKGAAKSTLIAALAAAEALGDVLPAGFDDEGRPKGKPWRDVRDVLVQLAAVSEAQTMNSYTQLQSMIVHGPAADIPGVEVMDSFIRVPFGKIEYVTSSPRSREGARPCWVGLDQTETWLPGNHGVRLADTLRRNAAKVGGFTLEAPNAYVPGEESVAERSAEYAKYIEQGIAEDEGLLYSHREAPADTDLSDKESLLEGLRHAYGCASSLPCTLPGHNHEPGWVDLERIIAEIHDPATDPQDSRRYYLGQITHATDSLIAQPDWAACQAPRTVEEGEVVCLGFDGSRGKPSGSWIPDATALIGCTIDGHLFEIGVWQCPDGPASAEWSLPMPEIDAAVRDAFERYHVAAFYADPAGDWRGKVGEWEAAYGGDVPVKVSRHHPFEWWMTGGRSVEIERAVEAFEGAVRNRELTHDGTYRLTQHVLNARRRIRRQRLTVGKTHSRSPHKIDACVAAIMAYQGRLEAVAAGITKPEPKVRRAPVRIR